MYIHCVCIYIHIHCETKREGFKFGGEGNSRTLCRTHMPTHTHTHTHSYHVWNTTDLYVYIQFLWIIRLFAASRTISTLGRDIVPLQHSIATTTATHFCNTLLKGSWHLGKGFSNVNSSKLSWCHFKLPSRKVSICAYIIPTYACVHTYLYTNVIQIYTNAFTYIYMICIYLNMFIHMYVYMYANILYIHIYHIHKYHIHIHIYIISYSYTYIIHTYK